jgi:hypothetical protein
MDEGQNTFKEAKRALDVKNYHKIEIYLKFSI